MSQHPAPAGTATHDPGGDPATAAGPHEHVAGDHHPSDGLYVQIAVVLAVLTAIEVATYFVDFGPLFLPVLLGLMAVKFLLVVLFFMHLRFDARIFSRLFWAGFIVAVAVYLATLTTFQFWG